MKVLFPDSNRKKTILPPALIFLILFLTTVQTYHAMEGVVPQLIKPLPLISAGPSLTQHLSYSSHPPISIDGDQDFTAQALVEGWSGNGTITSPYVIEGYKITGLYDTDLIAIKNTDLSFRISNCYLLGGHYGISLKSVKNGFISDNNLQNNSDGGVIAWSAERLDILKNSVAYAGGNGISLQFLGNIHISYNLVKNSDRVGMVIQNANESVISTNLVIKNNLAGISSRYMENSIISDNNFSSNYGDGISLDISKNSTLSENIVANNTGAGISLSFSDGSKISDNLIRRNNRLGIYLFSSHSCSVNWNELIENNPTGLSQAYDNGRQNLFAYNYWNDWIEPDRNLDGLVDTPYRIDGPAANRDHFPRTLPIDNPTNRFPEHILVNLILIAIIVVALSVSFWKKQ
ncbi:MAG: nitrous oxide reductase family maturation protein NosD [Candidatus Heimdallarchaeota archaeon]